MALTHPGPMRPVAPPPARPFPLAFAVAWTVLLGGIWLIGLSVSRIGGLCAFVPCEPLTGSLGFVAVDDQVEILVGERSAPEAPPPWSAVSRRTTGASSA